MIMSVFVVNIISAVSVLRNITFNMFKCRMEEGADGFTILNICFYSNTNQ